MSEKKHRVFVYGTLKRGVHNHHLLSSAEFVGNAYTLDQFKMYHVGFPVIRESDHPDAKSVYGEVYDVDDDTLKKLDRLENEGVMYDRKLINVAMDQDNALQKLTHGREPLIDANVSVYVGNDKYWDGHTPQEYTSVNVHDELEWRP